MSNAAGRWWQSRANLALAAFLAVGGYFLLSEHRAHFIAALPWVLIGACVLMHLFMHGGGHSHESDSADSQDHAGRE